MLRNDFLVKQLLKTIFAGVFVALMFAARLQAQSPAPNPAAPPAGAATQTPSANGVTPANAPAEEALPKEAPPAIFYIGRSPDPEVPSVFGSWWPQALALPVSNSIICSWIVAAIILVVVRVTTWKNIKEIPSGMQNVLEMIVEGWENFMKDVLDPRVTRWVFPYATTFLIFIVLCNYVDLIPGVGSIGFGTPVKGSLLPFAVENVHRPIFRPPTSDANLTVAMTAIFLVMSLFWAIRYNGIWGFTKHIFGVKMKASKWVYPILALLFIFIGVMEVVSILFARPVALAMRLFGNIFAGETMLDMGFHMQSWLASLFITLTVYFYETFVCAVQGFVFGLLVVAFVGTMCTHEEEASH